MKCGFGEFSLFTGDAWELATQAIVTPVNCELIPGVGLGAEILRRAGASVQNELSSRAAVSLGEVVMTSGGELRCQSLIHAAVMSLSWNVTEDTVEECLRAIFKLCRAKAIQSLAIPTAGMAPKQLTPAALAQLFVPPVLDSLTKSRTPERIVLAVPSEHFVKLFEDCARDLRSGRR